VRGDDDPDTVTAWSNLALRHGAAGRSAGAIAADDQLVGRLDDTLSRIGALRDERAAIAIRLRESRDRLDLEVSS
jgi:hypothetical protein